MRKNQQDLLDLLQALSIKTEKFDHEPLHTIEQAKAIGNAVPGEWCKNLFLKDSKKGLWLVTACADTNINLKNLSKALQAPELRFANEELLMRSLGVMPGSVSTFGIINDHDHSVNVVLDKKLFNHKEIALHPLENTSTLLITPDDLMVFIQKCANPFRVLDFETLNH